MSSSAATGAHTQTVMVGDASAMASRAFVGVASLLGYTQTPTTPLILAHFAPDGHEPGAMHSRAQYFFPLEESCKMHCGFAFVPAGTSDGQDEPSHSGAQTSPSAP
mmetsp:Transcript_99321/g.190692  ORF Transcript_99321/g.190692 Transcript_99321/m.190692 type:complete len:106 (-) Transcript_99321:639-956(-)